MSQLKKNSQASSLGAFDGLRLLAAFGVLYSHSFVLTRMDYKEVLIRFTHGATPLAEISVYVFFAISGYLITQSWLRDPSIKRFMIRRLLRILPALVFVIAVSALIIGPLLTTLSLQEYFSNRAAWNYLSKIFIYPTQYGLPGIFENNPFPIVVNGSLWSLRLEFALYIIVMILGWLGLLRWRWVSVMLAFICLLFDLVLTQTHFFHSIHSLHQTLVLFENALPFFIGAALAKTNLDSKWLWSIALLLIVSTLLLVSTAIFQTITIISCIHCHYSASSLS